MGDKDIWRARHNSPSANPHGPHPAGRVDPTAGFLGFESPKKSRRTHFFCGVPVPSRLLGTLARLHLRDARNGVIAKLSSRHRTTAWRHVCDVMRATELSRVDRGHGSGEQIEFVTAIKLSIYLFPPCSV